MTVDITKTVLYKWVPRDTQNATKSPPSPAPKTLDEKWKDYQNRKLSPYGFMSDVLPNSKQYADGALVPIDLKKTIARIELLRFADFPADVDWMALVKEANSEKTIGALCLKLYTLGTTTMVSKYGGIYDAFRDYGGAAPTASVKAQRQKLALAIFDMWENTDYRHAVISGSFDWSAAYESPWDLPCEGSWKGKTYRVASVPTNVPVIKKAPCAPVVTPQRYVVPAADLPRVILNFIKTEAKKRAKIAKPIDSGSMFYKRLTGYYLKEYLAAPSAASGAAAIKAIGAIHTLTDRDYWERTALSTWNKQPVPPGLRHIRPDLPETIEAGTWVLSWESREHFPYIDSDALLGPVNVKTGNDDDVKHGGKNVSQLMHWATGVKYHHHGERDLRDLFFGYEIWHLEGWDVFGDDSINDMIAEDAGRMLGDGLRAGTITAGSLQAELSRAFASARAWVGSLLRARYAPVINNGRIQALGVNQLDAWALLDKQRPATIHWNPQKQLEIWGADTIKSMLAAGRSAGEVQKSALVERIVGIYTLVFEVDEWERANGPVAHSRLIESLLAGKYDMLLAKMATNKTPDLTELEDAAANAEEPEEEASSM